MSKIVDDDGQLKVMSAGMLKALQSAFDDAEQDQIIVILVGRRKAFSAGFDLKVLSAGSANEIYTMLKNGVELALGILSFPTPIVVARSHPLPVRVFLLLCAGVRIAADADYGIGMNEVAIALAVLRFGHRDRAPPFDAHLFQSQRCHKLLTREPAIKAARAAIDADITFAAAREIAARRTAEARARTS